MNHSFQVLRDQYSSALKRFIESTKDFEVITSLPLEPRQSHTPEVVYVLDSSFNPPTFAHRRIACSAILENPGKPARLLLLLATQNADKPSKPASFEDRLIMMQLFAQDLLAFLRSEIPAANQESIPVIDIGVTKKPYFVDKAAEIESAGIYPQGLEQVHLIGYDTLIRIFNPKYYPPEHTLQPLEPFLSKHRLRVTMRPDSEWGSRAEQEAYLANIARGGRESEGAKPEWAQRIRLVEGKKPEEKSVSSTRAREAIRTKSQDLEWLVPRDVQDFILTVQPYSE
ncbi:Putative Cytidylyltransferase family protein (AFU_orthologue; AFUA_4G07310) [Aspergillus calidoustus]|jgi:nicotinamide-nucleotide adenylyltransferase|uniref:Putative Cytidylyltransferase family protein (AFU_orthologue AFUA_4G07310) n=1 Tax=Aspergillus calidoustus TaxID=454130 RepID=A0A0U5C480_ASPCI|nr:Putative Cytidylyltransferase family protein (AFU_orthologue; AFUA_4G07310) [Aspergillus calidoustus]